MNEPAIHGPCIVFALGREAQPFLRLFPIQQSFPGAPCPAWFCGPSWLTVLVVESGVGGEAAQRALRWALGAPTFGNIPYRPRVVVSAGFSGALREGVQVGDVLLASEVVDGEGRRWPTTWPGALPPGDWQQALLTDRLLSLPRLLGDPREKRHLGEVHGAAAVDMETACLAESCARAGILFGALRAISDDVETALSDRLVGLLSGGQVSPFRALAALVRAPRLAGEFWRLAANTRTAAERLGSALGELLTLTLPWAGAEK